MIEKYDTPESHLILVKGILAILTDILEQAKIMYFIDGGTLLGAVRHQDIIKHDDDADIGVFYKDFMVNLPKLYSVIEKSSIECNDVKYHLKIDLKSQNIIKIYIPDLWVQTETRLIGTPTVDIFPWQLSNGIVELNCPRQRKQFKNCFYLKNELFPLQTYKFGDLQVKGAFVPMGYLNRYYGNDCLSLAKIEIRAPNASSINAKAVEKIEYNIS